MANARIIRRKTTRTALQQGAQSANRKAGEKKFRNKPNRGLPKGVQDLLACGGGGGLHGQGSQVPGADADAAKAENSDTVYEGHKKTIVSLANAGPHPRTILNEE